MVDPSTQHPDVALAVQRLRVRFGATTALDDVSFTVPHGGVTAILGPNAAGKTTLLRAIAGLIPHDGAVIAAGADVGRLDRRERARRIGYVPQHSRLDAPLSVFDVVAQGRYAHRRGVGALRVADRAAIEDALRRVDALDLAACSFVALSHGQRRRAVIARALATGARLLLFDEPTASLDIGHALGFLRLARDLADAGAAVVAALHGLDDALRFADAGVLLHAGRVVTTGPIARVVAAKPIRDVYGVDLIPDGALGFREAT
jgi:iron complex transport system ATP-binding protein